MHIRVEVKSNAGRQKIVKNDDGSLTLYVKEPAVNNLANLRVLAILRDIYPGESVHIVSGHHRPRKLILVGKPNEQKKYIIR